MSTKPRVAFFSFTCCEGCQLAILSCEDELPSIARDIEIVNFREAMTERSEDYSIAFVEGSISRRSEIAKLKKIRSKAAIVVSLGACSTIGGINCLKNRFTPEYVRHEVYGKKSAKSGSFDTIPVKPIDSIIKVDHYIHGCPISKKEFLYFLTSLLLGKSPVVPNYPVCVDCKMAGNTCVFEKGMTCVGPVTRAGCDAICVTYGSICWGCRGFVDDPNVSSHSETLKRYGLTPDEITKSFNLYGLCKPVKKAR